MWWLRGEWCWWPALGRGGMCIRRPTQGDWWRSHRLVCGHRRGRRGPSVPLQVMRCWWRHHGLLPLRCVRVLMNWRWRARCLMRRERARWLRGLCSLLRGRCGRGRGECGRWGRGGEVGRLCWIRVRRRARWRVHVMCRYVLLVQRVRRMRDLCMPAWWGGGRCSNACGCGPEKPWGGRWCEGRGGG